MRPLAVKLDREKVRPCHSSAALHGESTGLNIRPVVHPIDLIHGEAFKKAVFNHGQGAARTFFGRLEHQNDAAAKVPMLRKVTRGSQKHRRVAVMTAGMHFALDGRLPRLRRTLRNGKRIHIAAQTDRTSRPQIAVNHADDPVTPTCSVTSIPQERSFCATIPAVRVSSRRARDAYGNHAANRQALHAQLRASPKSCSWLNASGKRKIRKDAQYGRTGSSYPALQR